LILSELIDNLKSKYLKRILRSKDPEKTVEEIEKELSNKLNGEERKKYKNEL
jgi:hypothetical protein